MIEYKKGSLFDAPKGSILAHACNCKGVWGSGIAVDFKRRFPLSYEVYKKACLGVGDKILGKSIVIDENGYTIICLFTSLDYGERVDHPLKIQKNTMRALDHFFANYYDEETRPLNMPKINSGRFNVPWPTTEKVLNEYNVDFKVWEF